MKNNQISLHNAFLMMLLIVFWGSSFVVVKIALREGLTPISIATFRFLIAGALFLLIFITKKNSGYNHIPVRLSDLPSTLLLAFLGVTAFFTVQYTGIELAGAAIASVLVCLLSPILITVFSIRLFKERLSKRQLFGVGVAAVGTFTIIASGTLGFQDNEQFLLGSLILLLTPFLWTAYTLYGKKIMEKYDPFVVATFTTLFGGMLLVPFSFIENSLQKLLTMSTGNWLTILYLSVTCSLIGYYIWLHVINQVKASITSSFLFAEPLITALLAIILVEEKVTLFIVAGGLLVFLGVHLVTRGGVQE